MSVFKSELNWSTYQDKQMKVLESIERSLSTTEKGLNTSFSKLETILTFIGKASEVNAKNIASMTKEWTGTYVELDHSFRDVIKTNKEFSQSTSKAGEGLDYLDKKSRSAGDNLVSGIGTILKRLWDRVGRLEGIGRTVDGYSEISNSMIKISSLGGYEVREFRSDLTSIVSNLNKSTGYLYDTKEAYSTMVAVSQNVTNNTEALEAMTRPLLLSSETLDININNVAELFNRFYTRYTFSSANMEHTLDAIRGNTAGNSADAEKIVSNINTLEGWMNRYAGSDNELREQKMKEISQYSAWTDSMGLDSAWFSQALDDIAGGNWSEREDLRQILAYAGYGDLTKDTELVRSGNYNEITKALVAGLASDELENLLRSTRTDDAMKVRGLDTDLVLNASNLMKDGFISLEDFIEDSNKKSVSMEEAAEDKYVSATDKINNWLSKIYDKIAKLQEINPVGFGVSDVAAAAALTKGVLWGKGGGNSLLGNTSLSSIKSLGANSTLKGIITSEGLGSAGVASSNALGKVAALGGGLGGAAMLAGGVAAGGALTVDGIKGMLDEEKTKGYRVGSGVQTALGVGGAGALVALGVTNPIGWAALAVGGLVYLGKAAYENAHELSGNAKEVKKNIEAIGNSLQDENRQRLSDLSELSYQFKQEKDLESQKQLMLESGYFSQEDLQGKSEEQLQSLIDSYKNAASAMKDVTDGVLKLADTYYSEQQNIQQKDFINSLKNADLSEDQMFDVVSLLQTSVSDEKLSKKFEKYLKDGSITKSEFNDLLYGGKNSWFDKVNLEDKSVDISGMQSVAGYLGWDKEFVTADNAEEVAKLYNKFATALNSEERDKAWQAIVDNGLEDEVRKVYGNQLAVYGYATGSNYIPHNQLAYLHEGEAVVPKKFNPAASGILSAKQLKELFEDGIFSSKNKESEVFSEFLDEMIEIKELLKEWKESNSKQNKLSDIKYRNTFSRTFMSTYLKTSR